MKIPVSSVWIRAIDKATNFQANLELAMLAEHNRVVHVPLDRIDLLAELVEMAAWQMHYPTVVPARLREYGAGLVNRVVKLRYN